MKHIELLFLAVVIGSCSGSMSVWDSESKERWAQDDARAAEFLEECQTDHKKYECLTMYKCNERAILRGEVE